MAKYSITRALAELKLLDKRIRKMVVDTKTSDMLFVTSARKADKNVIAGYSKDDFKNKARNSFQSVMDLIERRKEIKSKIVASNAKTVVDIAGKSMTVANAIERKAAIEYEKLLLGKLKSQYIAAQSTTAHQNELVQLRSDELLEKALGDENRKGVDKANLIAQFSQAYREEHEYELVDPINVSKQIEDLENEIDSFESEVDYVLSTSNSITEIEV